jgi:hypothetical protein
LFGVELLVEDVEGPDDGASREGAGGEDAPADIIVYEAEFSVGVNHTGAVVCMGVAKSNWSTKRGAI